MHMQADSATISLNANFNGLIKFKEERDLSSGALAIDPRVSFQAILVKTLILRIIPTDTLILILSLFRLLKSF